MSNADPSSSPAPSPPPSPPPPLPVVTDSSVSAPAEFGSRPPSLARRSASACSSRELRSIEKSSRVQPERGPRLSVELPDVVPQPFGVCLRRIQRGVHNCSKHGRVADFFHDLCRGRSQTVFAATPFFRDAFELSRFTVGFVVTALTLGYAVWLLPVGSLVDRFGERRVLVIGLVGLSAGTAAVAGAPTYALLLRRPLSSGRRTRRPSRGRTRPSSTTSMWAARTLRWVSNRSASPPEAESAR
jgi:hypothetical protein